LLVKGIVATGANAAHNEDELLAFAAFDASERPLDEEAGWPNALGYVARV